MRDYGTGEWAGGDTDCDHDGYQRRRNAGSLSGTGNAGVVLRDGVPPNSCKCGARRVDQQLGLEPTPELYVARMVEVFREVRRVLRADGTCFVNLGDSYASAWACDRRNVIGSGSLENGKREARPNRLVGGLKEKDLVGIPWRVAFALQADGWYLRSDIIWAKPNPMPESVTDRPTKAHEYVFLLTKSPRYFFDAEAVREPHSESTFKYNPRYGTPDDIKATKENPYTYSGFRDVPDDVRQHKGKSYLNPAGRNVRSVWDIPEEQPTLDPSLPPETPRGPDGRRKTQHPGPGPNSIQQRSTGDRWPADGANVRSVWHIATQPYPEAHFATYPEELVRRCVLAGSSERGCCPVCGKPWEREVEREGGRRSPEYHSLGHTPKEYGDGHLRNDFGKPTSGLARPGWRKVDAEARETLGWRPGCDHNAEPVPCVVLDPFLGSGTTAYVARKHGRRSIGIELNPAYADLAARRMAQQSLEFAL